MNVRVIPRTAVNGYLKLVRTPLDTAIGLLPANGTGAKPAARLAVDRADASLRSIAGTLLGDPVLRADGEARRQAAHERDHGLRLRSEAQQTAEQADARMQDRQQQAHAQRQRARETASTRRRQAETKAQQQKQRAQKAESQRLKAARTAAAQREQAIENRAPQEELQTLEAKNDAIHAREQELAARDEAQRLAEAASEVKAERKAGN